MSVRKDIFTFLLFVVLAAFMWYGHAMQSVRNTRVPVCIQYTGKPGSIGFVGDGLPDTIMIEVRDAGARLNAYHRETLRLTIDLHTYIHGDKGTIYVPSDVLRRSISDILQGTSRLIETSPEEISCSYFTEQEKSVEVVFGGTIHLANEYQLAQAPQLGTTRIKIYGQDKALSTVDTIYTAALTLHNVSDTSHVRLALVIPPGMRAEQDSIDLRIVTERFTEKKFTLPVHMIGVPEGYTMRLFPPEVEVSVRVGMSHFAQVQAGDIRAVCTYTPERKDELDVELRYSNPYITAAWSYPGIVEFLLIEK